MRNSRVLGATREEQNKVIEPALGTVDAESLEPLPEGSRRRQADVVIFDENLLDGKAVGLELPRDPLLPSHPRKFETRR